MFEYSTAIIENSHLTKTCILWANSSYSNYPLIMIILMHAFANSCVVKITCFYTSKKSLCIPDGGQKKIHILIGMEISPSWPMVIKVMQD